MSILTKFLGTIKFWKLDVIDLCSNEDEEIAAGNLRTFKAHSTCVNGVR